MKAEIFRGSVVFSKKGRDKGRVFVVLYSLDADYVMICDGDLRKLDHPKKKKRLHLSSLPVTLPAITALADEGQLKDSDVRKALAQVRQQLNFATKGPVSETIVSEEGRTFVQR